MLQGNLSLHDVEDLEAFVASFLQRSQLEPPPPWSSEDFLADLVSFVWELSLDYDGSQGSRFSAWARYKLGHESVNWIRRKRGRTKWQFATHTYERAMPSFVPLDDRPESADPASEMDAYASGLSDLLGLHGKRGSPEHGSEDGMGTAPARVAA